MIKQLAIACTTILLAACSTPEKEQRQRIPDGTYRPSGFHSFVTHGEGNIPISLVKADSLYHLFYTTGVDEWGHLSSHDLLSWKPEVSFPIEDDGFGAVLWDESDFTGLNAPWNIIWSNGKELFLSYSQDGSNWTEFEDNPILTAKGRPSVSWSPDLEQWIMTVVNQSNISVFTSSDLLEWNPTSSISGTPECETASLLSINGHWMLMTQSENLAYQKGSFDGTAFISNEEPIVFTGIKPSRGVFMQRDGETILINRNATLNPQLPTFTSPLSLSMSDSRLLVLPSETFQSQVVGKRRAQLSKVITNGPAWYKLAIDQDFEEMEIKVADNTSDLRVKWNTSLGKISFGGTALTPDQELEHLIDIEDRIDNTVVEILIDHASVDLFINDGTYATSILAFPDTFFSQVEVFLDGEKYDARTILLEIGI